MIAGKLNICTDSMWGSCAKGAVAGFLTRKHLPQILSCTNMANAGHTVVNTDGEAYVAKAMPSPAILAKWLQDYKPIVFVGATAAFEIKQLLLEIARCGLDQRTVVHSRAAIITDQHRSAEQTSTKHIASTMQGCGACLAEKIMRGPDVKLARDYEETKPFVDSFGRITAELFGAKLHGLPPHQALDWLLGQGWTMLHEGSQGYSLDISHGSHYPACTSRGTTAMQNLADLGLNQRHLGDIYLVCRPFPIRVGNVYDQDGACVGYSGDCYPDQREMTWDEVGAGCGAPVGSFKGELTTVTKRLRRVFSFSPTQLKEAVIANGATKLALTFADYLDWSCAGVSSPDRLSDKIYDFVHYMEDLVSLPVVLVGTGPRLDNMVDLCS